MNLRKCANSIPSLRSSFQARSIWSRSLACSTRSKRASPGFTPPSRSHARDSSRPPCRYSSSCSSADSAACLGAAPVAAGVDDAGATGAAGGARGIETGPSCWLTSELTERPRLLPPRPQESVALVSCGRVGRGELVGSMAIRYDTRDMHPDHEHKKGRRPTHLKRASRATTADPRCFRTSRCMLVWFLLVWGVCGLVDGRWEAACGVVGLDGMMVANINQSTRRALVGYGQLAALPMDPGRFATDWQRRVGLYVMFDRGAPQNPRPRCYQIRGPWAMDA